MSKLSNKVIEKAIYDYCKKNRCEEINLLKLATVIGVSHSSLWFYRNEKRKWNIEIWIKTLLALGSITIEKNNLRLEIPIDKKTAKELKIIKNHNLILKR